MDYEKMEKLISQDNSVKIKYIILFFVFLVAISQNLFKNIFGCKLNDIIHNIYLKHIISILFLFLLVDLNTVTMQNGPIEKINPLYSLIISIIIYGMMLMLFHSNKIYLIFIIIISCFLIVLDKIRKYLEININDQEILQSRIDYINKMDNLFVIIIILCITIGGLTSFNLKELKNTLYDKIKKCKI